MRLHTPVVSPAGERNQRLVREYVDWLRDQKELQPHTQSTYRSTLAKFFDFVGDTSLERIWLAKIEDWMQRPRQGRAMGSRGSVTRRPSRARGHIRLQYSCLLASGWRSSTFAAARHTLPAPLPTLSRVLG
jgi:site-specific recombinase XerD